ncbi:ammonium transporter (TC 1.A.11) [Sphingobium faniae]|nr:ammonium transporter (TC 1.A.11) [Sphingobium faniae]
MQQPVFPMRPFLALPFAMASLMPQAAFAQEVTTDSGDTAWMMLCAMLVLLAALPGVALRMAGVSSVRSALSAAAGNIGIAASLSLAWAMAGYSLIYAPGDAWLGGIGNLMLANLTVPGDGMTVPESAFVLFQMSLALFAACLVGGAVIGRGRAGWLALFAPLWLLLVYVPVAHWTWGGGWLANIGVMDFAGGIVVHVCAGFSALSLGLIAGRRAGKTSAHAPLLGMAGGALIWLGSAGSVGGWALGATDDAATAILNGHFAACAGALGWMVLDRLLGGRATATGAVSGALAGIAAIAASAALVGAGGAMLIGLIAALVCRGISGPIGRATDDPARIFLLHGIGGMVGGLLLPVFVLPLLGGVGFEGGIGLGSALLSQVSGLVVVALWSMAGTAIAAFLLSVALPLRISAEEEESGPDAAQHGEQAWDFR